MLRSFTICVAAWAIFTSTGFARDTSFVLTLDDSAPSEDIPVYTDQPGASALTATNQRPQCAFADRLTRAANDIGLSPNLVISVAYAETRCRHEGQRSQKGAIGLMQLMPATARRFGVNDPWNIDQNIAAGTAYLAWLDSRFDGDLSRILAGYNAGEGAVDRHNGVPPFAETRAYVAGILKSLETNAGTQGVARARIEATFVLEFETDSQSVSR
ncbi:MAG: lytic transglycosylase domain-containing protein [Hyphomonadaceae bacterium]|nr:lytic transglycosylase domain-containing protein [Hyphomonadaceae bacterium]